nr:MAG TPA: transcriptional regulator [Caudoviricetes sp.]
MGAIRCDCCNGLIRVGEVKFSLGMGQTALTICNDCKGSLVSSAEIHGVEDEIYL